MSTKTFEEFLDKAFTCGPDGTQEVALCHHAKGYLMIAHQFTLEAAKREARVDVGKEAQSWRNNSLSDFLFYNYPSELHRSEGRLEK